MAVQDPASPPGPSRRQRWGGKPQNLRECGDYRDLCKMAGPGEPRRCAQASPRALLSTNQGRTVPAAHPGLEQPCSPQPQLESPTGTGPWAENLADTASVVGTTEPHGSSKRPHLNRPQKHQLSPHNCNAPQDRGEEQPTQDKSHDS